MGAPAKTSFVHRTKEEKKQKKGLAALLLLFSNRKGALALVVAGALVVFLMLAPFGFDLGRFADYLSTKPALTWLAHALHSADQWLVSHGFKASEDAYKDMYVAREGDLSWRSASAGVAANGQDGVNPEALVDGGKALAAANDVKAGDDKSPRALHPDETKGKDPVVPVDGALAGGAAGESAKFNMKMSDLGSSAFGSGGTFNGPIGGLSTKDSLLKSLPNLKPPSGEAAKVPPGMRMGRMSKFGGGSGSSGLSGRSGLVAGGGHYRYRLGAASQQTVGSENMPLEDSALWSRAWATGEQSEDGSDPGGATAGPTAANPDAGAGGSGFAGAMDMSMGQCGSAAATLSTKMDSVQAAIHNDSMTLAGLGFPNNPPACCDYGNVDTWNNAISDEQNQCNQGNVYMKQAQNQCAALTGSAASDCSGMSKAEISKCDPVSCLVMLITEALSFIPIIGNVINASIALATIIAAGVVWLFTAGQAGGAVNDLVNAAGDAAQNIIAFGGASATGGDSQEQATGNTVGAIGKDWGQDVTSPVQTIQGK